jgi:hypothetical protein
MINPKYSTHYGDIIKSVIRTYRVPVSVFAYNVEQIAYCSDHNACLSAMSNHRVCFSAARRPVREYRGVKADEYVFHQAFRRFFVHFILNEYLKNVSHNVSHECIIHRRFSAPSTDLYYMSLC